MNINLESLNFNFTKQPLLIGGKAKEYYEIRKAGADTDLVVSAEDYEALAKQYPDNLKDLWGDLGVVVGEFEIWKSIVLFDYDYLSRDAIQEDGYKVIAIDRLLLLTALGMKKEKYMQDLKLIVDKITQLQYKGFDTSKYQLAAENLEAIYIPPQP